MRRLALKLLTASDLTLFEWHFRNRNAGNQKAINLNADVFVEQLFPAIGAVTNNSDGKLPLDLWIVGPGNAPPINLQRKIIKGGAYKNWRLDGEFIFNPIDHSDRFNILEPGDYVIFAFDGDIVPEQATALFVAANDEADAPLAAALGKFGLPSRQTMIQLSEKDIQQISIAAALPVSHPFAALSLSEEIQEAAVGSAKATEKLLRSSRTIRLSATELRRAKEAADRIGAAGEELIAEHLRARRERGEILDFEWSSKDNAVSPFDFKIRGSQGYSVLDVKTTSGRFERDIHVSLPQLREMVNPHQVYRIYRVFELSEVGAKLRISDPIKVFADDLLKAISALPRGVTVDSVSVEPATLPFGEVLTLEIPNGDEPETDAGA